MDEEIIKKFAQDLFVLSFKKRVKITNIGEDQGNYFIEVYEVDADKVKDAESLLTDLLKSAKIIKKEFDSSMWIWRIYFSVDESEFGNYKSQIEEPKPSGEITITQSEEDEEEKDIEDEEKKYEEKDIVQKGDGITVYKDGVIDIDIHPWEFSCITKEEGNLKPVVQQFLTVVQTYDWTELVGRFLADDEFKDNELPHGSSISGRWRVRGKSPFGTIYEYEIRDTVGGDVPQIYGDANYGIGELLEWLEKRFKEVKPIEYTKTFKLPSGKKATFGINAAGERWQSWNRAPWLEELGL
jgi:hypothetical protein